VEHYVSSRFISVVRLLKQGFPTSDTFIVRVPARLMQSCVFLPSKNVEAKP